MNLKNGGKLKKEQMTEEVGDCKRGRNERSNLSNMYTDWANSHMILENT